MSEESPKPAKQKPQPSRVWIRGTDGKPSMSATFATISFVTTTLMYVASMFEKIGPMSIRPFDPAVCAAYLMPTLMLYFGRRATDAKAAGKAPEVGE